MGYKINKKKYKEFIDYALKTGFDNKESAKEQIQYLVNLFNTLPDPVKLYRLIFLNSPKDFNSNEPGEHYVLNKENLVRNHYDEMLYDYSRYEESKPYILTIESPKNKIDFDVTISNNLAYPHEEEISLKNKGTGVNIISLEKFKR